MGSFYVGHINIYQNVGQLFPITSWTVIDFVPFAVFQEVSHILIMPDQNPIPLAKKL
tara:strand:+ start:397 stop:567 length:171 start_codon:yes stop_codon:yes gene_type:complete